MSTNKINLGKKGEELVCLYLIKRGFVIHQKNYKTRLGEIDIIAQQGETLIFVEVKLRHNPLFYLSELIVESKQRKIITTARHYIHFQNLDNLVYRFDVALVERHQSDYEISYIENAFTLRED